MNAHNAPPTNPAKIVISKKNFVSIFGNDNAIKPANKAPIIN